MTHAEAGSVKKQCSHQNACTSLLSHVYVISGISWLFTIHTNVHVNEFFSEACLVVACQYILFGDFRWLFSFLLSNAKENTIHNYFVESLISCV